MSQVHQPSSHRSGMADPVLRCGRCNKPFDKQASLKRHGYYCRSRKADTPTRRWSCAACARRKARCDSKRPSCSGCVARSIECHYPATAPRSAGGRASGDQLTLDTPRQQQDTASSFVSDTSSIPFEETVASANFGEIYFGWDNAVIDQADFFNPPLPNVGSDSLSSAFAFTQASDSMAPFLASLAPPLLQASTSSTDNTLQLLHQTMPVSSALPLTRQPSRVLGPTLVQRVRHETGMQKTAGFILHTLRSFPVMMLRHTTLPPFIHPRLLFSPIADNDDDLEPLHNCISLMHMLNSRVAGSRKLFWRNVRMECERFCAENSTWNRWKWLAALQALCVYLILRLDEGQTEHNNFDYLMVAAVAAISSHLNTPEMTPSSNGRELTWKDWIFEESRRRLCVIYQILNLLVFFEPANMCSLHESQLLLAPLPAKRPLWEAADEASWRAESEKDAEAQVDFGLATSGELVKLQNGLLVDCHAPMEVARPGDAGGSSAWSAARWDEWSAGMDGFGGLVMLAASMLG